MNKTNIPGVLGSIITMLTAAEMTNEVAQILYYIAGALALLFSLAFTIWRWYKAAKADGKITEDEIEELGKEIKDIVDKETK